LRVVVSCRLGLQILFLALGLLAANAIAAVSEEPRSAAPVLVALDSISLDTTSFSPNGDDQRDLIGFAFRVQAPGVALVQVATPGLDDTLGTVLADTLTSSGMTTVHGTWDGRIGGALVPDGLYDFRFIALDTLMNASTNRRQFRVDTVFPGLDSLRIDPSPYTPTLAGSPQTLTVRFGVSQSQLDDRVHAEVRQGTSIHKVAILGGFAGDGLYTAPCYVCADSLEDGMAAVQVVAVDSAANRTTLVDSLDVNRLGPAVTLSHPANLESYVTLQADSITGRVVDRQIVTDIALAVSGALDTTLSLMATPDPDSTQLAFTLDVSQLFAAEGTYELQFSALDADGVPDSSRGLTYVVDRSPPPAPVLSPPLPAETRASDIDVTVHVDSTATELLITGAAIPWDPTQINGRSVIEVVLPLAPGPNTLVFRVEDRVGNLSVPSTANVLRLTTQGISAPEEFRSGDTISIDAGGTSSGAFVRILALDGSLVRTFEDRTVKREFSFRWDLSTPEGRRVRNGAYLVMARVEVGGATQRFRKMIAVIE